MSYPTSILWRREGRPGHEFARLEQAESAWLLRGIAVFEHANLPCSLRYLVACDLEWVTISARVSGWVGDQRVDCTVAVEDGSWTLNGSPCPDVRGCVDVDLNFSPSTNLLPIRRLNLAIGKSSAVHAAWLRFPGFTLEPLDQTYSRLDERLYRYESGEGRFVAKLEVCEAGLPVRYGNVWVAEAQLPMHA